MEFASWKIGDVTVTSIPEFVKWPADGLVPQATAESCAPYRSWLAPAHLNDQGTPFIAIQLFVIESQGQRIVVDGCIGNEKPRAKDRLNMLQTDFLSRLEAAGFDPSSVDVAMCTHLHVDHVGWHTRLVDGKWVPTYPRARYLFAESEWQAAERVTDLEFRRLIDDSIQPVIDAGKAHFVPSDYAVTDEVVLEATPGHTPGHVSVWIESAGEIGLVSGDIVHHPVQLAEPDWCARNDFDPGQARRTRRRVSAAVAARNALFIGSHFAAPTGGRLRRQPDGLGHELHGEYDHCHTTK